MSLKKIIMRLLRGRPLITFRECLFFHGQQKKYVNFIKILPKFIVKTGLSDYLIFPSIQFRT
jgi:hypothetical protein